MTRIVSMQVPRVEWLQNDEPDGFHRLSVRQRLRETFAQARSMGLTWLTPYVPQYGREKIGENRWKTNATPQGFVRACALRALRLHFNDSSSEMEHCGTCRVLLLASEWKLLDASVRFADMGDMSAWPIAFRVDAQRLEKRFVALAAGTWCVECDDAPWASVSHRCLWCERSYAGPVELLKPALQLEQAA